MKTPTWHLKRAKEVLEEWYTQADKFMDLSKWFGKPSIRQYWAEAYYKRQALRCKTLGLIFHDQHKLLLDRCWRKYD